MEPVALLANNLGRLPSVVRVDRLPDKGDPLLSLSLRMSQPLDDSVIMGLVARCYGNAGWRLYDVVSHYSNAAIYTNGLIGHSVYFTNTSGKEERRSVEITVSEFHHRIRHQ